MRIRIAPVVVLRIYGGDVCKEIDLIMVSAEQMLGKRVRAGVGFAGSLLTG